MSFPIGMSVPVVYGRTRRDALDNLYRMGFRYAWVNRHPLLRLYWIFDYKYRVAPGKKRRR